MKRIMFIVLLLASCAAKAETRRALIIGIHKYVYKEAPTISSRQFINLDGPVNDAKAMRDLLISDKFGFKNENITLITEDDAATRERILFELNKLVKLSESGDVVVIYYSGHGSQIKTKSKTEADSLDETIVPCDAWKGTEKDIRDIRDKELLKIYNELLDKGVHLIVIFDSCHSGGTARGLRPRKMVSRGLEPPRGIVDDPEVNPPPVKNPDVLFLMACKSYQSATESDWGNNEVSGAYTSALIQALSSAPVNEPIAEIFESVSSIVIDRMDMDKQEPEMMGTPERLKKTFLGATAQNTTGKTRVTVTKVFPHTLEFDGGVLLGINVNCLLVSENKNKKGFYDTVRITETKGLNYSAGVMKSGITKEINTGDYFTICAWIPKKEPFLSIYISDSKYSSKELTALAAKVKGLTMAKNIKWNTNPVEKLPAYYLYYFEGNWYLRDNLKINSETNLGPLLDTKTLNSKLNPAGHDDLFMALPATPDISAELHKKIAQEVYGIEIITNPEKGKIYQLEGRFKNDSLSYCLLNPDKTGLMDSSTLPLNTSWEKFGYGRMSDSIAICHTVDYARNIASSNEYLTMVGPPDKDGFPYKLKFRLPDGRFVNKGNLILGQKASIELVADKEAIDGWTKDARYIYIFDIQAEDGKRSLIYPGPGDEKNATEALCKNPDGTFKTEVNIVGGDVEGKPGKDTYVLITTDQSLGAYPEELFNSNAVKSEEKGLTGNPLLDLLKMANNTSNTKDYSAIPQKWSIDRFTINLVNIP